LCSQLFYIASTISCILFIIKLISFLFLLPQTLSSSMTWTPKDKLHGLLLKINNYQMNEDNYQLFLCIDFTHSYSYVLVLNIVQKIAYVLFLTNLKHVVIAFFQWQALVKHVFGFYTKINLSDLLCCLFPHQYII
jgi:hypothetical protein